jgi:phospho-N-acetylmuramoyl-pentapeptide-transferase
MGGLMIIFATIAGSAAGTLVMFVNQGRGPRVSMILVLGLMVGMGFLGFLDDYKKIRKKQNLGLKPWAKILGQGIVGVIFALLILHFPNQVGWTPANLSITVTSTISIDLGFAGYATGVVLFLIWANFLITAWSNAVNLADGLDGLASGLSLVSFAAYGVMCLWMSSQSCLVKTGDIAHCYTVRDPWDLAIVAFSIMGACFGFLWWNTSPAKIFMGDTGSLAIGGAFAGMSLLTHTEIIAVILGGVFVLEVLSDVIQISCFKLTRKRVFKMAPLHHHFELLGWGEVTVVVRFWLLEGLFAAAAFGIFYADWVISFGV